VAIIARLLTQNANNDTFITKKYIYLQPAPSNSSYIILKSVEPSISGKYICEISADAPSFHTEIGN